jgi:hypothetical protein
MSEIVPDDQKEIFERLTPGAEEYLSSEELLERKVHTQARFYALLLAEKHGKHPDNIHTRDYEDELMHFVVGHERSWFDSWFEKLEKNQADLIAQTSHFDLADLAFQTMSGKESPSKTSAKEAI